VTDYWIFLSDEAGRSIMNSQKKCACQGWDPARLWCRTSLRDLCDELGSEL